QLIVVLIWVACLSLWISMLSSPGSSRAKSLSPKNLTSHCRDSLRAAQADYSGQAIPICVSDRDGSLKSRLSDGRRRAEGLSIPSEGSLMKSLLRPVFIRFSVVFASIAMASAAALAGSNDSPCSIEQLKRLSL